MVFETSLRLERVIGVGVIPNRQLKSATRTQPVGGGLSEILRPTVKVRMRDNECSERCSYF
jgi:hypothetical protein